jgi:hypothetical protein
MEHVSVPVCADVAAGSIETQTSWNWGGGFQHTLIAGGIATSILPAIIMSANDGQSSHSTALPILSCFV